MGKQLIAPIIGLALVGAAIAILATSGADPEGEATGVSTQTTKLWERLGSYRTSYLASWDSAFDEAPGSPTEVIDAFNELAFAVTGPNGFWRKTVKTQWMGCQNDPETAPCKALTELEPEFASWDRFQQQSAELDGSKARRFLRRNHRKMMEYLDKYVPVEPSASGMKSTELYRAHLATAMAAML